MSNETALDPPHAKCPNTGAISWRKATTDIERSACYPVIEPLNLKQSEQQYDKKLEKYAVIIDEVNMIASQAKNISAAMADPPTASTVWFQSLSDAGFIYDNVLGTFETLNVTNKKYTFKAGRFWQKNITGVSSGDYVGEIRCLSVKCAPFLHFNKTNFTWWADAMESSSETSAGTYIYFVPFHKANGYVSKLTTYTFKVKFSGRRRSPIRINLPWELFYKRNKNKLPWKMTVPTERDSFSF